MYIIDALFSYNGLGNTLNNSIFCFLFHTVYLSNCSLSKSLLEFILINKFHLNMIKLKLGAIPVGN